MEVYNKMSKSLTRFAERIRELRGTRSQMEMASLVGGITQAAWAQWELGARQPKLDVLFLICHRLNASADWLLGLDNGPRPAQQSIADKLSSLRNELGKTARSMESIMSQISALEKRQGET